MPWSVQLPPSSLLSSSRPLALSMITTLRVLWGTNRYSVSIQPSALTGASDVVSSDTLYTSSRPSARTWLALTVRALPR